VSAGVVRTDPDQWCRVIVVVTPMSSTLYGRTATCLESVLTLMGADRVRLMKSFGTAGAHDRMNHAIEAALTMDHVTHVGIAESDMIFPSDAFVRLLRRGMNIVGANYRQRQQNDWTAVPLIPDPAVPGARLSSVGRTGTERVRFIGCGLMLIDVRAFRSVPRPWFSSPWMPELNQHKGIDSYLCEHAAEYGHYTFVDHDLSQHVEHIGEVCFGVTTTHYLTAPLLNSPEVTAV
jgi:hypothetical protein